MSEKTSIDHEQADEVKPEIDHSKVVDVLGSGKLLKTTLVAGLGTDHRPKNGNIVSIEVTEFFKGDSKLIRQYQLRFPLGENEVIMALDLCVALMSPDEEAEITTDPTYGYGSYGLPEFDIPPDSELLLKVKLLKVEPSFDVANTTPEQCFEHCNRKRLKGNDWFARGDYELAIAVYNRVATLVKDYEATHILTDDLRDCLSSCLNNMSASQLKLSLWSAASQSALSVIDLEPDNVKALFRAGKAFSHLEQYGCARSYLTKAYSLESSELIKKALTRVDQLQRAADLKNRHLYQRMMGDQRASFLKLNSSKSLVGKLANSQQVRAVVVVSILVLLIAITTSWYV